jgi:phage-related protein (TIGR01555 family)
MSNEFGRRPQTGAKIIQASPLVQRADSLSNALSGFGGYADRTGHNYYGHQLMRLDSELTDIYAGGGLGRKIVSCRPADMLRSWITFPQDTDGKILKALDALDIRTHLYNLLMQTELYRGAVMVLGGLDNALTLEAPLPKNANKPISFVKVYGAPLVLNTEIELSQNPASPYFDDFEVFRIQRRWQVQGQGDEIRVHQSRCIVSKGIPLPQDATTSQDFTYLYWGISRLQAVFDQLANSETAQKAFANLIHEATIAVSKIPGLEQILANADDAKATMQAVMDTIARAKSVLNMILLPEGGEFSRDSLTMAGWRDTAMIFREELAAVAEIPVPRLYGITSSGLGGGGNDSEASRTYDAQIQAEQEIKLRPIIARLVKHVAPSVGRDPEEPFVFNPLETPSDKEIAETRKIVADTDKVYFDMGALHAVTEIRESRFGGDAYSMDTKLDPNTDMEAEADEEIARQEALVAAQAKANPAPIPAPKVPASKPKAPAK